MKPLRKDKIGLEEEIKRSKQLMKEEHIVINKDNLDDNWSAQYHTNKQVGKMPYDKMGYILTPASIRSYKLKDAVYLKPENADELNVLGHQIMGLIDDYNSKFNQYTKE